MPQSHRPEKPSGQEPSEGPTRPDSSNAVVHDEIYGNLRADNRVVMRHSIALNIDRFKAAPDEPLSRPGNNYPRLHPAPVPFMSVIVPNFNGHRHLPTVLDALRRQTMRDFEILVADDASSDDSVALVEFGYPEARLLVNRRNQGFVCTVNAAADAARGRVLVLLNSDTEPEPAWLAELARVVCANPQAAVVASKMLLFDRRDRLHTAGDLLGVDGIPRNRGVWEEDQGQYDAGAPIFSASGAAAAIRKEVWQALGGFDEDFWMYLEDVDFAFRARLLGWQVVLAPEARVYHRISATGGDVLASFYVGRNTLWNMAKNMPIRLLLAHWPQIVGGQISIALDALRHVQGAAARARLRGQWAGLAGLAGQLRKRQAIQPRRRIGDDELARLLSD